jgi:outer membrane protein TolC
MRRLGIQVFILLAFSTLASAESINQLIQRSFNEHPTLKSINYRLSAMDEKIAKTRNWQNPDLAFTINDIQFNDISNRSLEPMQYQAVNFRQKFPWFGKLDAKETFTLAQKNVILDTYDIAKVKLAEEVRTTAYTILEYKERIAIVKQYETLTQQNIALYDAYTSTDTMSHSNSMSAELMLSRLHIRRERYTSVLNAQEAKLAYFVQKKHVSVSDRFKIYSPRSLEYYLSNLQNNPAYKRSLSQSKVASANRDMKALDVNPDPFVQVGYFNRQAFEDYASVSVGFALPIYGSEKLETEAARKEALAAQSTALDYKYALESEIRVSYVKMKEAYRIYNIIEKDSLPKLQHMFELNEASIESGDDLFTYTNLLEQKLNLDEERTIAKAAYLRNTTVLNALIGKTK